VSGIAEHRSRKNLLDELHRRNLYPVSIEEVPATPTRTRRRRQSRRNAVAVWSRDFATLLAAGVPVDRALGLTADQVGHEGLAAVLRRVRRSVREGASIADALAQQPDYFPQLVTAAVWAGEASGDLDVVFEQIAQHLEEMAELRSQVVSALLYPAMMAAVASIGVLVMLLFVIPRFAAILDDVGTSLPLTTQTLVWLSRSVRDGWWLWLLILGGAGYGAYAVNQSPDLKRRWHAWRLTLPYIGDLELKYSTARFIRTLGMLLHSGVPIMSAIRIARAAISNDAVTESVDAAAAAVSEGSAVATALESAIAPMAVQMLAAGEESGRLEEACIRIADTFDRDVRRTLRSAVAMIEPILILVFGVLVGFVALAMLQAIYSINAGAF
jgi:type II secretory pathway component PulF